MLLTISAIIAIVSLGFLLLCTEDPGFLFLILIIILMLLQ